MVSGQSDTNDAEQANRELGTDFSSTPPDLSQQVGRLLVRNPAA